MANQVLRFDVTKQKETQVSQLLITGRVGDGGLKVATLELFGNQQPYNLTGINIVLDVLKPDDKHVIDEQCCTILDPQNGLARIVFDKEVFTAQGKCQQAFFKLMRGDLVDSTLEFDIEILPNRVEFGINSQSYLSEYDQLVEDLKAIYANTLTDLQNQVNGLAQEVKELENKIAANSFVEKTEYETKILELDNQLSKAVYIQQEEGGRAE